MLSGYDRKKLTIASLGGHSALDMLSGAKMADFATLAIARQDRAKTYAKHLKTRKRGERIVGCVDDTIQVEEFQDVMNKEIQDELRKRNAIFLHSRYFLIYFDSPTAVETDFNVPLFGSRSLVKLEMHTQPYHQRDLLNEAGIRMPRIFTSPDQIDRLVIVKVNEALRHYERAFFLAWDKASYEEAAQKAIDRGHITQDMLENAVIEEYVVGAPINVHFFFSPLHNELELLGMDLRRQTNLDGFLRMTSREQALAMERFPLKMIQMGHIGTTVKESMLERIYAQGEDFLRVTQSLPHEIDPTGKGMIGPFTFHGVISAEEGREEFVVFDVSFRSAGSPGIRATPYTRYLHGMPLSMGERIAIEIADAVQEDRLEEVVT